MPIYIENEPRKEDLEKFDDPEMSLLGVYWSDGSLSGRTHCQKGQPIIVLFRNNIKDEAWSIKSNLGLTVDDATVEHHLAAFVLSHELAHAYFDKEKTGDNYDTSVKKEIEECLANYVALLHAHNIGGLYYQIGKDLVNGQKGLKDKGYHHGLSLFNGDEPAFTGWWKWRYCHSIKEKASLNDLVAGSDLAAIFDLGLVKQQETTETLERE